MTSPKYFLVWDASDHSSQDLILFAQIYIHLTVDFSLNTRILFQMINDGKSRKLVYNVFLLVFEVCWVLKLITHMNKPSTHVSQFCSFCLAVDNLSNCLDIINEQIIGIIK